VAVSKYNILLQKMESAFAPNGLYRRVHDKDRDYNHYPPYSEYGDKSSTANPSRKVPLATISYLVKDAYLRLPLWFSKIKSVLGS